MQDKVKQYVGKKGMITCGDLLVEIKVIDYKNSYGRDRFKVTPIAGSGEAWREEVEFKK